MRDEKIRIYSNDTTIICMHIVDSRSSIKPELIVSSWKDFVICKYQRAYLYGDRLHSFTQIVWQSYIATIAPKELYKSEVLLGDLTCNFQYTVTILEDTQCRL
ncbi:unnamed protein product [Kuraishia capsulata CBS 1993]|uniref:Uncharacterized protein n=1 Tax=Kuraishia capsulata CBS 1993 TaxID=1382522 RepID=W6MFA6_9ASCO|nr:uncharacterized protein KUCA_T00000386001 [Kuraishia capsulata CBS 1993]CDK24424.1 unnamed protein product [Kuraishia capsulata CBS 1993]